MRQLVLLIVFCASGSSFSQKFADKAYFIIDSLDISTLSKADSALVTERLDTYHNTSNGLQRIVKFSYIANDLENTSVRLAYAIKALSRIRSFSEQKDKSLSNKQLHELRKAESNALMNFALVHSHLGNHHKSLTYLYEAKEISEEIGALKQLTEILLNIGGVFYDQSNLKESLVYHQMGAELNLQTDDTLNALHVLNNMGAIYNNLHQYDKAKVVLDSCIVLSTRFGEKRLLGMALNNLGGVFCMKNETVDTGIVLLEQSLQIFEELQFDKWLGLTYSKLANVYLEEKQFEKAHEIALKSEKYADKLRFKELIRRSALVLRETFAKRGDYKNAFLYSEKYLKIDQALRGEETRVEALRLKNKLTLEKQKEIDRKELAMANAARERQQTISYSLIGGSVLLLAFAIFVVVRLRILNRRKQKIEQQNNERSLLLKEIHHRVKNNFQVISSLLRLQAAEEDNERIENAFDDAISRIQSMTSVHELICKQEMFAELSAKDYLDKLIGSIRSYSMHSQIKISAETDADRLNIKTLIPLGITINELVTNSLKYAFDESSIDPQIKVSLNKSSPENEFSLIYQENGTGFDHLEKKSSFGMEIIDTVVNQIDGVILRKCDEKWKNKVEIQFKEVV